MARVLKTITDAWQLIAADKAIITIKQQGEGNLLLNDIEDIPSAEVIPGKKEVTTTKIALPVTRDTYARTSETGREWIIVVDDLQDTSLDNDISSSGGQKVVQSKILFASRNALDRRRNQWEEPIIGAKVQHGTVTGGPFQVGDIITGDISDSAGTVTIVGSGELTYDLNHDDFEVGEIVTGSISGASATLTAINLGSTVFHDRDKAAAILQVGQNDGDSAARVSHRWIPAVDGNSQSILLDFKLKAAVANVEKTVGYGYLDDGLFINQTLAGLRFIRRTNTSGTPADNKVERADWNVDKFDGTGPSGKILKEDKLISFFIDSNWPLGPVRMGINVDGIRFTAHEFRFFGVLDDVFMSTPTLPIFFEIKNTGATESVNTMTEISSSVLTEGDEKLTGLGFSASTDDTPRVITGLGETPIMAVRLLNSFNGGPNRKTIKSSTVSVFPTGNDIHFELLHLHDPSGITATWIPIGGGSAAEYSVDISVIVGSPAHKIGEDFAAAGQAGKGIGVATLQKEELDQHRLLTQDIDSVNSEVFLIVASEILDPSPSGATRVSASQEWLEFG